ncbi:class I SAM-dependent methyltransferase [Candidatus Woesearchaeota archaeon]|nr:class I SAM-dependent methyltransferase [Candidatus Woesearchaeota archaeon]
MNSKILTNQEVEEIRFKGFSLSKDDVYQLLFSSGEDEVTSADSTIQRIVSDATPEKIPLIVGALNQIYDRYANYFDDFGKARIQGVITLARYELEVAAGSYVGSFVLPPEVFKQLPQGRYLEIALGPGDNLKRIALEKPGSTFEGIDISLRMVERARKNLGDLATVQRGNAMGLQYQSRSFDAVIMLNALDRIPDPQQALLEVSRVLKPGGTFVVGNCMPLQNVKEVEGGVTIIYVPEGRQIDTMEQALAKADCTLDQLLQGLPWDITTIEDGPEKLFVDLAIGKKAGSDRYIK